MSEQNNLSAEGRLSLVQFLNGLPPTTILELEFALKIPHNVMPSPDSPLGIRTNSLLRWVESSTGIGLPRFLEILKQATGFGLNTEINSSSKEYDLVINDFSDDFLDIERQSDKNIFPGILCGFYDLDAITSGFQRSDLIVLSGSSAMGKSSLVSNIARNIAATQRLPVLIFSLEMTKQRLVYRLLSSELAIESNRLNAGHLTANEWTVLGQGINQFSGMPIFIDDTPNISLEKIHSQIQKLYSKNHENLGLVLIDYVQLIESPNEATRNETSLTMRSLKELACNFDVPILAISQLYENVENRFNKRPLISDLEGFRDIEKYADLIMMLYREEYYDPDTPDRGIAEIIITKHRNGPTGTVKLLFEPQYTRFRNLAQPPI